MKKKKINKRGLQIIKDSESLSLDQYLCPAGIPTIGWGHTGKDVENGMTITEEEAEELLRKDLTYFEAVVDSIVRVPLNDDQFSALVSFVFNVGSGNFRSSTLLRKLNSYEYDQVKKEMKRWIKTTDPKTGKKIKLEGLVTRRKKEAELFNSEYEIKEPNVCDKTRNQEIQTKIRDE